MATLRLPPTQSLAELPTGRAAARAALRARIAPRPPRRAWPDRLDAAATRTLDLLGAGLLLALLVPLLAAVAVAITLDSPGRILFRQERVGRGGRPFALLKFRSMRVDADQRLHASYVAERIRQGLPLLKLHADPRITRVGRWIRASSIDELPQLWNVLRGDMSLVGPRPALAYEVELYNQSQRRRLLVRPGITGLAQVRSRGSGTIHEYIGWDLEYVARRTVWLDVLILIRTVPAVLRGRGAS